MHPITHALFWPLMCCSVLFLASSCGRKGPPRAPQDVLPQTIADLRASDTAEGIQLSWSRPRTYADSTRMMDLAGFVVERAVGDVDPLIFGRISVLEVTDRDRFRQIKAFRYLDRDAVSGVHYRYRVVSFTLDRYFSLPSNVVTVERTPRAEELHAPFSPP